MRLTVSIALAFLLVLGLPTAQAKDTPTTERPIDLSKIMGTWYVIARMPNPVERGHVADIFTHPKHATTQTFLAEVLGDAVPVSLASRLVQQPAPLGQAVIRVQVRGSHAGDTLVARLARELSVDVALLAARIDEIGGQPVGSLILGVPGGEAAARQTLAYLSQHQFAAERLGYVS